MTDFKTLGIWGGLIAVLAFAGKAIAGKFIKDGTTAALKLCRRALCRLPRYDPLRLAVEDLVKETSRPVLKNDFLRWFRMELVEGELQKLRSGQAMADDRLLNSLSKAASFHESDPTALRELQNRFYTLYKKRLLASDDGETIHREALDAYATRILEGQARIEAYLNRHVIG